MAKSRAISIFFSILKTVQQLSRNVGKYLLIQVKKVFCVNIVRLAVIHYATDILVDVIKTNRLLVKVYLPNLA